MRDIFHQQNGIFIPNHYFCFVSKKEQIINASIELLTQNGVHATPMSAIAKKAGTGMGTIYNHFPTKEVLINEIYQLIKTKEETIFTDVSPKLPVKTRLENYYKTAIFFFLENPSYFLFMEQLHASPMITEESRAVGTNAVECVFQLIEQGKQEGIVKNIDTFELMQFIGGSVFSYVRWSMRAKHHNTPKSLSNQLRMIWDAIKA